MYRSFGHVKFPKFQTGIFVEWKAPVGAKQGLTTSGILVQNAIWREENRLPLIGGTSRDDWLTP